MADQHERNLMSNEVNFMQEIMSQQQFYNGELFQRMKAAASATNQQQLKPLNSTEGSENSLRDLEEDEQQ